MSLSIQNILDSTDRLTAFFSASPEQKAQYAKALLEAVAWMKPYEFDEVCKAMVSEVTLGRKPVPKQFVAMYHKIAQERRWLTPQAKSCKICGGHTWVYCSVQREDGSRHRAMKGCPECRKGYQIAPWLSEVTDLLEKPETWGSPTAEDGPAPSEAHWAALRVQWESYNDAQKSEVLDKAESLATAMKKTKWLERFAENIVSPKPKAREVDV